jgi:hypothetical protein
MSCSLTKGSGRPGRPRIRQWPVAAASRRASTICAGQMTTDPACEDAAGLTGRRGECGVPGRTQASHDGPAPEERSRRGERSQRSAGLPRASAPTASTMMTPPAHTLLHYIAAVIGNFASRMNGEMGWPETACRTRWHPGNGRGGPTARPSDDWPLALCAGGCERDPPGVTMAGMRPPRAASS